MRSTGAGAGLYIYGAEFYFTYLANAVAKRECVLGAVVMPPLKIWILNNAPASSPRGFLLTLDISFSGGLLCYMHRWF